MYGCYSDSSSSLLLFFLYLDEIVIDYPAS